MHFVMVVYNLFIQTNGRYEHGCIVLFYANDPIMDHHRFSPVVSYVVCNDDSNDDAFCSASHLNFRDGKQEKEATAKSFRTLWLFPGGVFFSMGCIQFAGNYFAMVFATNIIA
jgi:hypothetical protein